MESGNDYSLAKGLVDEVQRNGIIPLSLLAQTENPVFDKYDEYLPTSLLHKAYAADKLCPSEAEARIIEIYKEYTE
jgi:hypothetical protein